MDDIPQFDVERVDLTDWLKSRTLMGEFRGKEIWNELRRKVAGLANWHVLFIDTTKSLFLDYDFACYAITPLFADTEYSAKRHFVIFQIASTDRNAFFHGILKGLGIAPGQYSHSKETFVEQEMVCKLIEAENSLIEYVGRLSQTESRVLQAVNERLHADVHTLETIVSQSTEEVLDALRTLAQKGFVIDVGRNKHEYYSFENYFRGA